MKTEELKALGLTEEQITAVMKQNGQDVESVKARYADYDNLKSQLEEAGKTIEGFKAKAGDAEGIQKAADEWKAKAEQAQKQIETVRFDYALDKALAGAGAKNTKAVRALLDTEGLKLDKEEIGGLEKQLEKIKADNDYLFASQDNTTPRFSAGAGSKEEPTGDMAIRSIMGLPNLNKE